MQTHDKINNYTNVGFVKYTFMQVTRIICRLYSLKMNLHLLILSYQEILHPEIRFHLQNPKSISQLRISKPKNFKIFYLTFKFMKMCSVGAVGFISLHVVSQRFMFVGDTSHEWCFNATHMWLLVLILQFCVGSSGQKQECWG